MRNAAMIIMIEVARLSNGSDHKPPLKVDASRRTISLANASSNNS